MEAAAIMAIALAHGGGKDPDYPDFVDYHDFVGIIILLVINSTICFIEENNAGHAAAALMAPFGPKSQDGARKMLQSWSLVTFSVSSMHFSVLFILTAAFL
ncbi:hypothetical protein Dsin_004398 [Dipteronia sinensis]|uniref:Uncharacterized protein n=1 Tax=Dipteronia sinensis TaxID=43782 RepID=A0AAE0B9Y3_9ROSI|nr:hypothetical protein Dsin_004398 [Dipteronia sinensis]